MTKTTPFRIESIKDDIFTLIETTPRITTTEIIETAFDYNSYGGEESVTWIILETLDQLKKEGKIK